MRNVEGYSLWLGHVGDVVEPEAIIANGILAVVDLALNEPPASLPRDLDLLSFPIARWSRGIRLAAAGRGRDASRAFCARAHRRSSTAGPA